MSSSTTELLSLTAAAVSALGGAFAAWAAFRSASAARSSQEAAARTEHRVAMREVANLSTEVEIEYQRVLLRSQDLKCAHQTLQAFSGGYGSSSLSLSVTAIDAQVAKAAEYAQQAALFTRPDITLSSVPPEELDRVSIRLTAALKSVRAILVELDREHGLIESQNAERRQSMQKAKYAK